ncbi:MAG TPA: PhnD/SsuA/transferrin family substrate-binding protein [Micropepsaceae bacterium]|nr:PhnD/SsuA/transferrin family substrate-binding protein [Micropepsaceae bacterium]
MANKIKLDLAIGDYPHTAEILNGAIPIEGVEPNFIRVVPQIGAYRRMVRQAEFDVCDIAPTTYIIARAYGAPFTALPVFLMRRFHHGGLLVRPDAGIRDPKDLAGRKVGVRAYSVTTGVWTRAILLDEYGVDHSKITWVVDDEEHVTQLKLPENVVHAPEGRSLADMMADGELAAVFEANAGIGRSGSPAGAGWQVREANYPPLFPNADRLEAAWHRKTGIYPIHGTVVVKDNVLNRHPWVARSLLDAFSTAKNRWLEKLRSGAADSAGDRKYRKFREIVGDDPLPFGTTANLPTMIALADTAFRQKLTPRRMAVGELFADIETG